MKRIAVLVVLIIGVLGEDKTLDEVCGRIKVKQSAWDQTFVKPEEWPWHVLIQMNHTGYYFDGTLISKNLVLTVASYASDRGNIYKPDHFSVALNPGGEKYEDKEVDKVIVHEQFESDNKIHDIALLKLKNNVDFNDFVQPACIWSKSKSIKYTLPSFAIGTVVGYESNGDGSYIKLNSPLRKNTMPIVSEDKCKASKAFYSEFLTDDKFCAENQKGITLCIGDTGAPYQVFVPDDYKQTYGPGAWYIRGLLQRSPIKGPPFECDPEQYFLFTDIEKHYDWIEKQIKSNE